MAKKGLASNFVLRFFVTVAEKLAGIAVLPLLVDALGVAGYGYFTLVCSLSLVCKNVLTLRLPLAVIRFYPSHREQAGPVVAVGLLYWGFLIPLFVLVLPFFGDLLAVQAFGKPGFTQLLVASVMLGMLAMLYEFLTITFRAENEFGFISAVDALERVLYVLLCVVAVWLGWASVLVICVVLMMTTLAKIVVAVRPSLRRIHWAWPSKDLVQRMFLFSLPYLPFLAGLWILERGAFFFLERSYGPAVVGTFSIAFSLAAVLESAMGPLQTVLYPAVRKTHATGTHGQVKHQLTMALRFILFAGIFGALVLCLGVQHIFRILSIKAEPPSTAVVLGLSSAVVVSLARHVLVTVLNLEMNTKALAWTTPLVAMAFVPVYLTLISQFGASGAALASFLAAVVNTVVLARFVPRSLFPLPSRRFVLALISATAGAVAVLYMFRPLPTWQFLIGCGFAALLYLGISYWLGAFTEEEKQQLPRFFRGIALRVQRADQG